MLCCPGWCQPPRLVFILHPSHVAEDARYTQLAMFTTAANYTLSPAHKARPTFLLSNLTHLVAGGPLP